jgi:starch-binding outer membrane protein, SusD/RagB family
MLALINFYACTDLEIDVESEYTEKSFPSDPSDYFTAGLTGPVYTKLRQEYCMSYWFMQELSSDEAILPARGGNWYDGGKYKTLHQHSWNTDHGIIHSTWSWAYSGISICNSILNPLQADGESSPVAAELKTMRALYYFFLLDLFGNVPIITQFGDTTKQENASRAEVFGFIEKELIESYPLLKATVDQTTYGRPTKYMALSLLAKIYLNAEVYIGQPKYQQAVAMCDSIIQSGKYDLDDDYIKMFYPNNGHQIREFIFAIPYNGPAAPGQFFARYYLHPSLQAKYGIPFRPSNAISTLPEFHALFNDPSDVRNKIWLTAKQYNNDGSPINISTTKAGLDNSYTGADKTTPVTYHLEFTPDLTLVGNPESFDLANDELGKAKGYRCIKFFPDASSTDRNQNNDVPIFRYADILLTKAEAILRGAAPTLNQNALQLTNQIRTKRKATPLETVNLNTLLDERAREFVYENWRRNDLIRFGKFNQPWSLKAESEPFRSLFPIPAKEIQLNANLKPNPGY